MPTKIKKDSLPEDIKNILIDLLSKLSIAAEITVSEEADDHYKVTIQTEETGLLIGRHGETINSLQLLLGVILYKKTGSWVHVVLDVGDYRKMREDSIKSMVDRITAEVTASGAPVTLPYLNPFERRLVHMMLAENKDLTSESTGEGKDRRVTIKLREAKTA